VTGQYNLIFHFSDVTPRDIKMTINPLSNDGLLNAKQWALFIPLAVHFFSLATSDSLFTPLFQNQVRIGLNLHGKISNSPIHSFFALFS